MWPNSQFPANLVTFTEEILTGKPYFLYSAQALFKNGNWGRIRMEGVGLIKKFLVLKLFNDLKLFREEGGEKWQSKYKERRLGKFAEEKRTPLIGKTKRDSLNKLKLK